MKDIRLTKKLKPRKQRQKMPSMSDIMELLDPASPDSETFAFMIPFILSQGESCFLILGTPIVLIGAPVISQGTRSLSAASSLLIGLQLETLETKFILSNVWRVKDMAKFSRKSLEVLSS